MDMASIRTAPGTAGEARNLLLARWFCSALATASLFPRDRRRLAVVGSARASQLVHGASRAVVPSQQTLPQRGYWLTACLCADGKMYNRDGSTAVVEGILMTPAFRSGTVSC